MISGPKVNCYRMTNRHIGFMSITRVAKSCRLGNQAVFVLGPDVSANQKKVNRTEHFKFVIVQIVK